MDSHRDDGRSPSPSSAAPENSPKSSTDRLIPAIDLPKGGGAVKGIGETFTANVLTGSASLTVPLDLTAGRGGTTPSLALTYDSGGGNGPFGIGWSVPVTSIRRKSERGLPRYDDGAESDVFLFGDTNELTPALYDTGGGVYAPLVADPPGYHVVSYRPRIEGAFTRIERWTDRSTGIAHWKITTRENLTSIFGQSEPARIADPADPARVYAWYLERTADDRGNVVTYEYQREDLVNVDAAAIAERHRLGTLQAQTYLKRVRYGNAAPFDATTAYFEVVFDYGEHDLAAPAPSASTTWPVRSDPFSTYRPTFELRTYRLCRRVLVFHHFSELGTTPTLVRSTDLTYAEDTALTHLVSVTRRGYIRQGAGYASESLPPLDLAYTRPEFDASVHEIDAAGAQNLPEGADGKRYRFVDLDGEGIPGVLFEGDGGALYYKRNRGGGAFAPLAPVDPRPSMAAAPAREQRLLDLAGDGRLSLVTLSARQAGYSTRMEDGRWTPFAAFATLPRADWDDPNLRFVDLDGDGVADVLQLGADRIVWYRSDGYAGFVAPQLRWADADETRGPRVVFTNADELVVLADMSGDGLRDVVRIRNGDVCYWPNLGFGRFGAKVVMANGPFFDAPDAFEPARLRLADIDGTGTSDLIYLGPRHVVTFANQAGNGWGAGRIVAPAPPADGASNVDVVDLLGRGTACLTWSSPLPGGAAVVRYIDLIGPQKPHLLQSATNNLGAATTVHYSSSTAFYLADRDGGTPWVTRLPFPVHVVDSVTVGDAVSATSYTKTYRYRHGYYDRVEREFRGFGYVEQRDTDLVGDGAGIGTFTQTPADQHGEFVLPTVLTKTWNDVGAFFEAEPLRERFAAEFFAGDSAAAHLAPAQASGELTPEERRQAAVALHGRPIRTEVYALDGSAVQDVPYSVAESVSDALRVQPAREGQYASFLVTQREYVLSHYERDASDPRVTHDLTLNVDPYGNVTRAATVGYPRRAPQIDEQGVTLIQYHENDVVNATADPAFFRLGVVCESRTYEVTGALPAGALFTVAELNGVIAGAAPLAFEAAPSGGVQRRLIRQERTLYYSDDLSGPLALGAIASHALPYQRYHLAYTPALLSALFGTRVTPALLTGEGGYVALDGNLWIPSDRAVFDPAAFFQATGAVDPYGHAYGAGFDAYKLCLVATTDPLGNAVSARINYRTMSPWLVTDPNGGRGGVRFDALGRVVAQAVLGANDGDADHLDTSTAEAAPADDPTSRTEYHPEAWSAAGIPAYVRNASRHRHGAASDGAYETYAYADGLGRTALTKVQAEPGPAPVRDLHGDLERNPDGSLVFAPTATRWVGTGRTVYDNKGNAVKKYEPFFDSSPAYVDDDALRRWGVTPIVRYDPLDRAVRTDQPDGTLTRVVFDPWRQTSWDANDTVLESAWYAARSGLPASDPQRRAADAAAAHAGTPGVQLLDSLGRPVRSIADAGGGTTYETRTVLDIQGHHLAIVDALGRHAVRSDFDMAAGAVHSSSIDAGERWTLADVSGKVMRTWDGRGNTFRSEFDLLHRQTSLFVADGAGERLIELTVYGEAVADAAAHNLRTRIYAHFDGAGCAATTDYDFDGNAARTTRQFTLDGTAAADWSSLAGITGAAALAAAASTLLETTVYATSSTYDALKRPLAIGAPDGSVVTMAYDLGLNLTGIAVRAAAAAGAATPYVGSIAYTTRGERESVSWGNGATTAYQHDPLSYRLTRLLTTRPVAPQTVQDQTYVYDPVGNITEILDGAQQTVYYDNAVVTPDRQFVYDPLYQLISASGREQIGQAVPHPPPEYDWSDAARVGLPQPSDGQAMRRYTQTYAYDGVGNLALVVHTAGPSGSWRRRYAYDPARNRVQSTSLAADGPSPPYSSAPYGYDAHGNATALPHLAALGWNARNQLASVDLGGGGSAAYTYDSSGMRARKSIVRTGGLVDERYYVGAFELYRKRNGATVQLERQSLHVLDGKQRVALIETKTVDLAAPPGAPSALTRYQLGDFVASSSTELDPSCAVISYEEYYPFGASSYQAGPSSTAYSLKRFRYTGTERDDETGLQYDTARYYAPWLGRWIAPDPAGLTDGVNLYRYGRNNPVRFNDPTGTQPPQDSTQLSPFLGPSISIDTSGGVRLGSGAPSNPAYCGQPAWWLGGARSSTTGNFPSFRFHTSIGAPGVAGLGLPALPSFPAPAGGSATPPPAAAATATAAPPTAPPADAAAAAPADDHPLPSSTPTAVREGFQFAVTPTSATGDLATGPLRLWSGAGKADALADVASSGGWMMGNINGNPTQLHLDGEIEFAAARARALATTGSPMLPDAEFTGIWGMRSARVVGRGVLSGAPVYTYGDPAPTSIQTRYEIPTVRILGPFAGSFMFGTGMYTAISGAQTAEGHPVVQTGAVTAGVAEATGGIMYGAGAFAADGAAMAIGSGLARFGGGVGQAIVSGYLLSQDIQRGDTAAAVADGAGALGGVLITASLFCGPAAPFVFGAGLVLSAFSVGFHLGRWLAN